MPNLFTLPGPRTGVDNRFSQTTFSGLVSVGNNMTLYASLERMYWSDHNAASFENHGTIWNVSNANIGGILAGFYLSQIYNTGTMIAEAVAGNATAIFNGSFGDTVNNSGSIYAIANGNAAAIQHWGPDVRVSNSGIIVAYAPSATSGGNGGGVGSAAAVSMFNGGVLTNAPGASILAEGLYATAVLFGRGSLYANDMIRNDGRIEASISSGNQLSYGISAGGVSSEVHVFLNNGLLRADVAWSSYGADQLYAPRTMDQLTNNAGGVIIGRIETGRGQDSLVNHGSIVGTIDLGDEMDVLDMTDGSLTGSADLGWHNDSFFGSAGVDVVTGNRGDDFLRGAGGNDLLLGGVGQDYLSGDLGNDGLYGELGDDQLVTAGADRAFGGDGNDVMEATDFSFALISGGAGHDTLRLSVGPMALDLTAALATGRLTEIERIDLQASQRVAVQAGNVSALSGGTLEIFSGYSNGQVALVGNWVEGNSVVREGNYARSFRLGNETVFVGTLIDVTIVGSMPAGFGGLAAIASGESAPLAGSVPGGALANPALVISGLYLDRPIDIDAGEAWSSPEGSVIIGYSLSESLVNDGLIEMHNSLYSNAAVANDIYSVINGGTIRGISGSIQGTGGINIRGFVQNSGTIEAIATTGYATAVSAVFYQEAIVVDNRGTISARSTSGTAIGVQIGDTSGYQTIPIGINSGLIEATGGTGTRALAILDSGTFYNTATGRIVASNSAGSAATDATAIFLYNAGYNAVNQVINDGIVTGRIAVFSEQGVDDIVNRGMITGTIQLGTGVDNLENAGGILGRISLGDGADRYLGDTARSAVEVDGGAGIDLLVGGIHADQLEGADGNDLLIGGAGADTLVGGAGADRFMYRAVTDSTSAASDLIQGFESGIDRVELVGLAPSSITLGLAGGITTVTVQTATGTLSVRVSGTIVQSDIIVIAPNALLTGTASADILFATVNGSDLAAAAGDDQLFGTNGNDRLDGGIGADVMIGGLGDDIYIVDDIGDRAVERDGGGTDQIFLSVNFDMVEGLENVTLLAAVQVRGNNANNIMVGSVGEDSLYGANGDDLITGGLGADFLGGGFGVDRYIYRTAADSTVAAPDRLSGFEAGVDRIDLSALTVTAISWARFSSQFDNFDRVTIQTTTGTMEIRLNLMDQAIPLSMSDFIFAAPAIADVRNDFNGDGRSDILWRNVDGQMSDWLGQANGGFVQNNANAAAVVPTSWSIAGTGDFNGDGRDDILWRNVDGQLSNWLATASGGFVQNNANAAAVVPTAWSVAGTGDFNGDGRDDILWRNTNGTVSDWLGQSNGGFIANDGNAARFVPTSWSVVGTGDFNGDGRDDILWRNSNGQLSDWLGQANGGFVLNDAIALTQVDTAWSVVGTGDFNGDGRDDILWRNTNGTISTWSGQANGGFVNNGAISGVFVPLAWSVVAVGDYNGDGRDDILWRNSNGTVTDWLANPNGSFTPNDAAAAQSVPTAWHVQPEAPFI